MRARVKTGRGRNEGNAASTSLRGNPTGQEIAEGRKDSAGDYAADLSVEGVGVPRLIGINPMSA